MDDVRLIAKKVRRSLEIFAHSHDSVEENYHKNDDLDCMCAVASVFLAEMLKKYDIFSTVKELHCGCMSHCFIIVNDHAIDLTATQFRSIEKKVMIKPLRQYLDWFISIKQSMQLPRMQDLKWIEWPVEQQPRPEILQKLEQIYHEL